MTTEKKKNSPELAALAPKLKEQCPSAWKVIDLLRVDGDLTEWDLKFVKEIIEEIGKIDGLAKYRGLGWFYAETDPDKSREYYKKAADKGCPLSMRIYASKLYFKSYEDYLCCADHVEQAYVYALASAKLGDPTAQHCLTTMDDGFLRDAAPEEIWSIEQKVDNLILGTLEEA